MEPSRLARVAPQAQFRFIAHLPEWRLHFPMRNGEGGLPSVQPQSGNTVWGVVFSVEQTDLEALHTWEAAEGRVPQTAQAMDREGHRHQVVIHVSPKANGEYRPAQPHVEAMVSGSRHWKLPAGWVASLEEHIDHL
jgi:cation transport regulator ChaC